MSRAQTRGEEWANALSHFLGVLAGIAAIIYFSSNDFGNGAVVFGLSLVLLYSVSTVYHLLPIGKLKHQFRILDHSAIFILIAGTYTPFLIEILDGSLQWILLSGVWLFATAGVLFKVFGGVEKRRISIILYILMGWIFLMLAKPLWTALYPHSIFWLLAGGLFYTVGVFFYTWEKLPYNHFIWHLFVLAGSLSHIAGVYRFETA